MKFLYSRPKLRNIITCFLDFPYVSPFSLNLSIFLFSRSNHYSEFWIKFSYFYHIYVSLSNISVKFFFLNYELESTNLTV